MSTSSRVGLELPVLWAALISLARQRDQIVAELRAKDQLIDELLAERYELRRLLQLDDERAR